MPAGVGGLTSQPLPPVTSAGVPNSGVFLPKMDQWMSYQLLSAASYPYASTNPYIPASTGQGSSFLDAFAAHANTPGLVTDTTGLTTSSSTAASIPNSVTQPANNNHSLFAGVGFPSTMSTTVTEW